VDEVIVQVTTSSGPGDLPAIRAIDTAFDATEKLTVERVEGGFRLVPAAVDPPVSKSFMIEESDQSWDLGLLAAIGERLVGFAALEYHSWNKRLVVSHFYVDRTFRRRGVGSILMKAVAERGEQMGADHLWIETSNFNVPAIAAYRYWGFELCGLDVSLYAGTSARGEVAIFLSRALHSGAD
jgi:ribosomal protein S18 acetylase RimI-like enzyme